jgi:hypothetical protein
VPDQFPGCEVEAVAAAARGNPFAQPGFRQRAAQDRHTGLDLRPGRRGRGGAPQRVEQRLQGHHAVAVEQQLREHHLLAAGGHDDRLAAADLQQAEHAETGIDFFPGVPGSGAPG